MPIDWTRTSLQEIIQWIGPPSTSMVPEFENIALYRALQAFGWPGCYIEHKYLDMRDVRHPRTSCAFLKWHEEELNAKGESPRDVIDGRYVSLAACKDLECHTVMANDDPELDPIPSLMDPIVARLCEWELLEQTPSAAGQISTPRL